MQHIRALPRFAAKTLAEEFGDIRLVINHEDAYAHSIPNILQLLCAWQANGKLSECAGLALDRYRATVLLRDDIVTDR